MSKKIIYLFMVYMLLMNVCFLVLLFQVHASDQKLNELSRQVGQLIQAAEERDLSEESMTEPESNAGDEAVTEKNDSETEPESQEETESDQGQIGAEAKHKVYLTFDDGPSTNTDAILDILDRYGVKATFFVVGKEDEASKEALQRIVEEGHTLGMHSYSHKYKELYQSVEAFSEDFNKLQDYLYDVTGVKSMFYRFPGGSSNTVSDIDMKEFAVYLDTQGVVFFDWNISSGDASSKPISKDTIVANCTDSIARWETSVVLMHDSAQKQTTLEALPEIIEKIQSMEDTVILPITEDTRPVQHIHVETN